jgi:lipopolysaccharide/colanic/teichoic acid biosynthesis glycosyltransferase
MVRSTAQGRLRSSKVVGREDQSRVAAEFQGYVRRRMLVRPGITGLWHVSRRSDLLWEDAVRLDLYYVENWSITLDLMILARTVSTVVCGGGA